MMARIICICLIAVLACSCRGKAPVDVAEVGRPAPGFALTDPSGRTVRLDDFKGRAVVLEFWATWCPPCIESVPDLNELDRALATRDAVVIAVSMDEGSSAPKRVAEFVRQHGITYLVLMGDGPTGRAYGVRNVPSVFVLDRQHTVSKHYVGFSPGMTREILNDLKVR